MPKKLTALVVGASRGIGAATALALAKQGYALAITARTISKELTSVVQACYEAGAKTVIPLALDVTDDQSIQRARERITYEFKTLSVLFNNAGVILRKRWQDHTPAEIRQLLAINSVGMVAVNHAFLGLARSVVITVGSDIGAPGRFWKRAPYYSLSKTTAQDITALNQCVRPKLRSYWLRPDRTATGMNESKNGRRRGRPPERVAQLIIEVINGQHQPGPFGEIDVRSILG